MKTVIDKCKKIKTLMNSKKVSMELLKNANKITEILKRST